MKNRETSSVDEPYNFNLKLKKLVSPPNHQIIFNWC